jgi:uncharacterized membrane protein YhaH (DUF805 family)
MSFTQSIKNSLTKNYASFSGRASRTEFWYFVIFIIIGYIIGFSLVFLSYKLFWLLAIFMIAIIIPALAVTARRLHDINKTGWLQLLPWPFGLLERIFASSGQESLEILFIFIGLGIYIYLLVLYCTHGDKKDNKYGKNIYKKARKSLKRA